MPATIHPMKSGAPRSIQGEQDDRSRAVYVMEMEDVDTYTSKANDEVLKCRIGGHRWPFSREVAFSAYVGGYFIRRMRCECCELAEKIEQWEERRISGQNRWVFVDSNLVYHRKLDGTAYTAPTGRGRMTRAQVRGSMMTSAMHGMTAAQVRKSLRQQQKVS